MRTAQRGEVGFAEHFDTKDEIVGLYLDAETGTLTPTTRGLIHYGRLGAHIIPARPVGAETAGGDGSRNATSWIQASATRALTGQTPEPLRACSFQFDARQRSILLLAEVERPLTEDEEDGCGPRKANSPRTSSSACRPRCICRSGLSHPRCRSRR